MHDNIKYFIIDGLMKGQMKMIKQMIDVADSFIE